MEPDRHVPWRRHLVDATIAAVIAAAVMAIAVFGSDAADVNLGIAVLIGPAVAGALTAYLVPRIRALQVWLGQTVLGAGFTVVVTYRDHASAGGVLIGCAMIAVLGLGAAAAVHASRPVRRAAPLPAARVRR